jgi:hypothetical protein
MNKYKIGIIIFIIVICITGLVIYLVNLGTDTSPISQSSSSSQQSAPQALAQGAPQALAQGTAQSLGQSAPQALAQGAPQALAQGTAQALGQGTAQSLGQGASKSLGQAAPQALAQGTAQSLGQGTAQSLGQGTAQSLGQMQTSSLPTGNEKDGTTLYPCLATYEGGKHPGKTRNDWNQCYIGYGGKTVSVVDYTKSFTQGNEKDGTTLYPCLATYEGGKHPGKTRNDWNTCNIAYGSDEVTVSNYTRTPPISQASNMSQGLAQGTARSLN